MKLRDVFLTGMLAFVSYISINNGYAQEFAVVVSPPRIEDRAKAGSVYRNVIEINNTSPKAAKYTIQTADWSLDSKGSAVFTQALASSSCRPWVGIEAGQITVKGNGKKRFRFEAAVPANAPAGECTFAIMIEGEPQLLGGQMAIPVSGRIGVIVYLAIGDAASKLELKKTRVMNLQGQELPVLQFQNKGNMHGRLEGYLDGVDAKGKRVSLVPDNSPILSGATRDIALYPQPETKGQAAPKINYPIRIKGRLDSAGQRVDVEMTLSK
jgi:fimbrial chaperone protein